jgi:purine-binding chemotaxis protein CheW
MSMHELHTDHAVWHILEERARALTSQETITSGQLGESFVIFHLGNDRYRILTRFVHEIHRLGRYTPLPSAPPFVVGLVNVHGRLLAALDLRPLRDIEPTPPQPGAHLLIIRTNTVEVGILADIVVGVQQHDTALARGFSTSTGHRVTWIQGIDHNLHLQLDPELLLADPRLLNI